MSARANRISSPGAERIVIEGIIIASDDFNRIRVLVLDENGFQTESAKKLRGLRTPGCIMPFELKDGILPSSADDVRATCWFTAPAHRKDYWLKTAAELRNQKVRIEALVRKWSRVERGLPVCGVSLDLSLIDVLPIA